jgi:peptidyl-prolyl cis-trans isomerase D
VLAQVKAGKDFAELAKKNSDDTGSATNGGDLGWAERGYFVGPFADALFSMKPGEIRGPVKTQFGYHIIRLEEVQPVKTRTFEEARPDLESQLRRDRASDRFGDIQEQLQRKLEEPGADFDALAKELHLQTGQVAEFLRGTGGAPLGTSPELQDAAFSSAVLDEHRIGGPVMVGEDRIVIIKALAHHKPTPKPLAAVRDDIIAAIRKEHGTAAAIKAADAARARLESGASFDEVTRAAGATAEPARFVGRDDPSIPAQLRELVFKSPRPAGSKPVYRSLPLTGGGATVVVITQVKSDTAQAADLESKRIGETIDRHGSGDATAYLEELRRTANVSKNPKAFE